MTRFLASLAAIAVLAGPAAAMAQGAAPAAAPDAAAAPAAPAAPPIPAIAPAGNLIDTLKAAGQYTIFLKALDASNLTGLVSSTNPLTVLAPTDAAFNALPAGQLDNLLKIENATQLQSLLVFHLINSAAPLSKVQGARGPITNAAGAQLQFDGTGSTGTALTINNAKVVGYGAASNGFIYAVDTVLGPSAAPAAPAH